MNDSNFCAKTYCEGPTLLGTFNTRPAPSFVPFRYAAQKSRDTDRFSNYVVIAHKPDSSIRSCVLGRAAQSVGSLPMTSLGYRLASDNVFQALARYRIEFDGRGR